MVVEIAPRGNDHQKQSHGYGCRSTSIGMGIIVYLRTFDGQGVIPLWWDMAVVRCSAW
jgi:hypothetical protein